MPQTRSNKSQTPINSDAFNLIPDLATIADTLNVVVPVADRTEADAVATARAAAGWPVTDARPLFVWNLATNNFEVKVTAGWKGGVKPFGHMGKTDTFQALTTISIVNFGAAQTLRGGMTFDNANDALVVPLTGLYRINAQFYTTGAGSGTQIGAIYINGTTQIGISNRHYKGANDDTQSHMTGVYQLTAGDKVQLFGQCTSGVNTWGSSAYNGDYVEVEFLDQW